MARLPSTVTVGPYSFAVVVDGTALDVAAHREDHPAGLAGQLRAQEQQLVLREGLQPDYAAETFLHELLHAVAVLAGNPWPYDDEERMVAALAPGLLHALRSPGVAAYLLRPTATRRTPTKATPARTT